jgi:hypothetical protein
MDKYCCQNCFSEPEIRAFIECAELVGDCAYCGSCNVIIDKVYDVAQFIIDGINRYYENVADQVSYESAEGGYQLPTMDIDDILVDEKAIFGAELDDPYTLLDDLALNDGTLYVRKNPYGPPSGNPDEIDYWQNFCQVVKSQRRFTTFLSLDEEDKYNNSIPANFLAYFAKNIAPSFIEIITPGTIIFRARLEENGKQFKHEDFTSPPPRDAKNNRMSPAGISFFYGALDSDTCLHEIRPSVGERIAVAEFEVINNIFILDLSQDINSRGSIFNKNYNFYYEEYLKPFLEHFISDISKPIRSSDRSIDYTPTQVFTEFIKFINFRNEWLSLNEKNEKADAFLTGVKYKSSFKHCGTNITLFRGPDISTHDLNNKGTALLYYKGYCIHDIIDINVQSTNI